MSGSGPPRDPPPVRGRTRRAAELGLAAAALLVAAAGSELALRALGIAYPPFYRTSADVGDSLLPGSEGWWTQEGRAHVRINADGMRDRDHDLARPPGTLRIAVLGDSYAEAFQVEQGEAFWAVLERALRGCPRLDGRRPELLNFGVAGYGTTQQLLMLQRRVWKYAPDLVLLLFTTGNDVRNNSKTLQGGGRPYLRLVDGEAVLDTSFLDKRSSRWRTSRAGDLWYAALQRSRLLQVLAQAPRAWRRLWEPDPARPAPGPPPPVEAGLDAEVHRDPTDPDWVEAWTITEIALRRIAAEVRSHDARLLLATGSSPIQVDPDPALRVRAAEALGVADLLYPDRRLAAFAEAEGIPFVMLAPTLLAWAEAHGACVHGFSNTARCQGHWNADGHRVAGEALAEALCRELPEPAPAGP